MSAPYQLLIIMVIPAITGIVNKIFRRQGQDSSERQIPFQNQSPGNPLASF